MMVSESVDLSVVVLSTGRMLAGICDRRGDDERPRALDGVAATPLELAAAAPAVPGLGRVDGPRQQGARLA
jgi:hypothetical protein